MSENNLGYSKSLIGGLIALAWAALIYQIAKHMILPPASPWPPEYVGSDFRIYYNAMIDFVQGKNPYAGRNYLKFPYPMFTVFFCSFLTLFSEANAWFLWEILMKFFVCAGFGLVIFCCKPLLVASQEKTRNYLSAESSRFLVIHWMIIAVLLCAAFRPAFWGLFYGNIQPLAFFLICLFTALILHGHDKTAGCVLAMACLVKITPVILVIGFLFTQKKRLLYAWFVFMCCYAILLLLTGWWRWELFFVEKTLPNQSFQWIFTSHSLTVYLGTIFFHDVLKVKSIFNCTSRIVALSVLFATLLSLYLAARRQRGSGLFWRDAFSLTCYPMLLISPLLEVHHHTCLIPALVFLLHDYLEQRCTHRYFAASLFFWALFLGASVWHGVGLLNLPFLNNILPPDFYEMFCLMVLWFFASIRVLRLPVESARGSV
ncbi:TPA: hypothetical protein DDW35_09435 [Candidatus Sumerlaeota bacterium]|nr:hypothetical protein [Candidatus Sumerlaeota bacterium]